MSKRSSLLLVLVFALFAAIGLSGCSTQAKNPLHGIDTVGSPAGCATSQPRDSKESAPANSKSDAGEPAGLKSMMRSSARDLPPRVATA